MSLAHGNPVRGNGLPAVHWTLLFPYTETRYGGTVSHQGAGHPYLWCTGTRYSLPACLPPFPRSQRSPPRRCRPCRVRRSGEAGSGSAARRRGALLSAPPPSRAVKVGQDRGTVRTTPIGRRPGAPAAHWLRREDGARRRRVRHGRQSSKKLG